MEREGKAKKGEERKGKEMDKTEDKRKEVTRIELKYEMTEEKGGNDQVVLFNPYFSMILF